MVVRLLGLLDLVAAVSLIFLISGRGEIFALIFALYLLIKSLFFLPDFSSFLDLFSGFYISLLVLGISFGLLGWLFVVWLAQKGIFSLFFSPN